MDGNTSQPASTETRPIADMCRLTLAQQEALKSRWLTTIDAFVAAAATPEGQAGLCKVLEVEPDALGVLLQDARDSLGEDRYAALMHPRPGGPTGALFEDQNRPDADATDMGCGGEPEP